MQYAEKVSKRTQSSVVDVHFGYTKCYSISVRLVEDVHFGFTKCYSISGRLVEDPDFRCRRCLGNVRTTDGRPCVEVQLGDEKLDVVDNFVHLGKCVCPGGCCELATIKRCRSDGENLENSYPWLLVKHFLETHVVKCITAVSEGRCFIHQNVVPSDKKTRNIWNVVKEQCCHDCATSRKNNM